MTWLKTSDDFPDDCARVGLSDAAYRTHHEGLSWVMRRETGGIVDERDIRRFAETTQPAAAVAELLAVGFWRKTVTGWLIVHGMADQPDPDVLQKRRDKAAQRQQRFRRKAAGLDEDEPT